MTFFPLPDEFYADPQFTGASAGAVALWARAASWSAHHLTDGLVPSSALPVLQQTDEQFAAELVERRIWKRTRGGFQFVVWPKLASRAYVEAKRDAARKRQENFRRSKGKPSRRDSRVSNDVTNGVTNGVSHASQSSPVPLSYGERGTTGVVPARDTPTPETRAAAIAACPLCDGQGYAGKVLCDHDPTAPQRAARGRAAVQAALGRKPPSTQDEP